MADLRWSAIDQPFLTTVTISHSEDLARWNVIGTGSIASLAIDDTQVRHSRIPLDGRTGGYYRIDWPDNTPAPWVLDQLDLVFSAAPNPTPVELVVLEPSDGPTDAAENALFFDAGGQLPVRAVELEFVNPNTWANAAIHTSDSLDGPWGQVSSRRLFYRVGFDGDQVRATLCLYRVAGLATGEFCRTARLTRTASSFDFTIPSSTCVFPRAATRPISWWPVVFQPRPVPTGYCAKSGNSWAGRWR